MISKPLSMVNIPVAILTTLIRKLIDKYNSGTEPEEDMSSYHWILAYINNVNPNHFLYVQIVGFLVNGILYFYRNLSPNRRNTATSSVGSSERNSKNQLSFRRRAWQSMIDPTEKVLQYLKNCPTATTASVTTETTETAVNATRAASSSMTNVFVPLSRSGTSRIQTGIPQAYLNQSKLRSSVGRKPKSIGDFRTIRRRRSFPVSRTRSGRCYGRNMN